MTRTELTDAVLALVDFVLTVAIIFGFLWLVIYGGLWLIGIVGSRFDVPPPVGVHEIAIDHPERVEVELSDRERDVLMQLDVRTEWEDAL